MKRRLRVTDIRAFETYPAAMEIMGLTEVGQFIPDEFVDMPVVYIFRDKGWVEFV